MDDTTTILQQNKAILEQLTAFQTQLDELKHPESNPNWFKERLQEQGTWRGILMLAISLCAYFGIESTIPANIIEFLAASYGVQNIITKG